MIKDLTWPKIKATIGQIIKFGLVGATNVFFDALLYWLFTRKLGFYYLLAAALSFLIVVTWSFFINRFWTFRYRSKNFTATYLKFVSANAISITLNLTILFLLVDFIQIYDLLAKVLVSTLVGLFNFSLNKLWTFRSEPNG